MNLLNDALSNDADSEIGDKWIFYHLPIKCRGNFVRLVLEESGIEYLDAYGYKFMDGMLRSPNMACNEYMEVLKNVSKNNDEIIEKGLIPPNKDVRNLKRLYYPYGSPFLVNFNNPNICLSQSSIIVQYLSNRYGLRPKSDINHYRAGMIVANCNDFFSMIYGKSLGLKEMENKKEYSKQIIEFLNKECQIWLDILSKPLQDRLYYYDDRITQCDLAVYNIMDCFYELFQNNEILMNEFIWNRYPNLKRHYLNIIKTSKCIKPLMKRQREAGVLWWPYHGVDPLGIDKMRKAIKDYAKSKYSKL